MELAGSTPCVIRESLCELWPATSVVSIRGSDAAGWCSDASSAVGVFGLVILEKPGIQLLILIPFLICDKIVRASTLCHA